uniref:Uncharacterized protein n=1 Tax=Ditylenchus dipsaci TaxID=166011 RepID=A0A915E2X2_9BILA
MSPQTRCNLSGQQLRSDDSGTETEAGRSFSTHLASDRAHYSCVSQILHMQLSNEDRQKAEIAQSSFHFDPTKGNVLFASAFYGYAFSLDDFALLWSEKLGVDKDGLGKHLSPLITFSR